MTDSNKTSISDPAKLQEDLADAMQIIAKQEMRLKQSEKVIEEYRKAFKHMHDMANQISMVRVGQDYIIKP
jgi:hypothetical protein